MTPLPTADRDHPADRRSVRTALVVLAAATAATAACGEQRAPSGAPPDAAAAETTSQAAIPAARPGARIVTTVSPRGDSLRVVTTWSGLASDTAVRVRVTVENGPDLVRGPRAGSGTDTVLVLAPAAGGAVVGRSCAQVGDVTSHCTPWQFVRPRATPGPTARGVRRIVVRPEGLQVDPDVGGRCAEWRERNPGRTFWIEVNERAVPACMGPNGRPTVAQFCAFAELADGRRVKTAASRDIPYCEKLYRRWVGERIS